MSLPQIVVPATTDLVGTEFQINSFTASFQVLPVVTALDDGGWVVVWFSYNQDGDEYGIYGQRYNSGGAATGPEFQVNTFTTDNQQYPSVASLTDGGWVVTWSSEGQDGSGNGIYGQRYAANGATVGAEFSINSTTFNEQNNSSIVGLPDGGWVVVWDSLNADNTQQNVFGQRFSSDGSTSGPEFQVDSFPTSFQWNPTITTLADGGWMVTWMSFEQDGSGYGIYGQRYASDGSTTGSEFEINTFTTNNQNNPTIASLPDGGWVVVWESLNQDGGVYGIYGQRYDASGATSGSEFQVNTFTSTNQWNPTIAALADGGWVVTWGSLDQDGSGYGVYAQRYAADGSLVGSETLINTTTDSDQNFPTVTALADGGWVATWSGFGQDGSDWGVFGQRFASPYTIAQPDDFIEDFTVQANADAITDPDGVGPVSWQWQRSTDGGANWNDIDGATSEDYTQGDDDVGNLLRVAGTYTDDLDVTKTIFSAASTAVININDMPVGFSTAVNGKAEEGSLLSASANVVSDDDGLPGPLTFNYQWQSSTDGSIWTDLGGETNATFTPGATEIGEFIRVQTSYTDNQGTLESVNSLPTAALFAAGTSLLLSSSVTTIGLDVLIPQLKLLSFDETSELFLRPKDLGTGSVVYELVANPVALSGSIEFQIDGGSDLIGFTLSDALDGWTIQQNDLDPTSISVSGMGAVDESDHLQAGNEVVLATFSLMEEGDLGASLSDAAIGGRGVASQSLAESALQADGAGDFTGTFGAGDSGLLHGHMDYDNSSRAVGAQDALEALRLAIGLQTTSGTSNAYDYIAADFNRDGRVGAQDALDILRFVVGLDGALEPDLIFIDASADLSGINRNNVVYQSGASWSEASTDTEITLVGIVLGDVNDSFVPA